MPVRVVITEMDGLLRDIVGDALGRDASIEVIEVDAGADPVEVVSRRRVQVVILGLANSELPEIGARLFEAQPGLKLLGVGGDGRRVYLYELQPVTKALGEVSLDRFVDIVREVADGRRRGRWADAAKTPRGRRAKGSAGAE